MNQKQIVLKYLEDTKNGNAELFFKDFVHDDFIHHNAHVKSDKKSFIEALNESATNFKNREYRIIHIVEENDTVMVYSDNKLIPGMIEVATMHIFKFSDLKIIEIWDISQLAPEEIINEIGMF